MTKTSLQSVKCIEILSIQSLHQLVKICVVGRYVGCQGKAATIKFVSGITVNLHEFADS